MGKNTTCLAVIYILATTLVWAGGERPGRSASTRYWWEQDGIRCIKAIRGSKSGDYIFMELCGKATKGLILAQEGPEKDAKRDGIWYGFDRQGQRILLDEYQAGLLLKRIPLKDGKKHGRFDYWYPDGTKHSVGEYRLDRPVGTWTRWWNNGRMKIRGGFQDGQKHGNWSWWCQKGHLTKQVRYHRGQKVP